MNIIVVLRNLYNNADIFDDEEYLSKSDRNIISEALIAKDKVGGKVSVLLLAEDVKNSDQTLKTALSLGVDDAYHIAIDDFDFSNYHTSAKLIAKCIKENFSDFDLVLFGRLAYDGDAVNISTLVSEYLNIPRIVYSKEFEAFEDKVISKKYITREESYTLEVNTPLVLQSMREKGLVRHPKVSDIMRAYNDIEIIKINAEELIERENIKREENSIELVKNFSPESNLKKELKILNGVSDIESSENLIEVLRNLGF